MTTGRGHDYPAEPLAEPAGVPDTDRPGTGPTELESRYRRLLRVLPRTYRDARADEMTDVFLADARERDPENWDLTQRFGSPSMAERRSVLALALRLRWADPQSPARYRVRLGALRMALTAYLTVASVVAIVSLATRIELAIWPLHRPGDVLSALAIGPAPAGPWHFVTQWAFLLWIAALVLGMRGGRVALSWASAAAAVPTLVAVVRAVTDPVPHLFGFVSAVVDVVAVLALVAVADSGGRLWVAGVRRWLVAGACLTAGFVILGAIATFGARHDWQIPVWLVPLSWIVVDEIGLWCLAAIVMAVAVLARARRGAPVSDASMLGLGYFAACVAVLRLATAWTWYSGLLYAVELRWFDVGVMVAMGVQCAAVVAIAIGACVRAAVRIRALPPISYVGPPEGSAEERRPPRDARG